MPTNATMSLRIDEVADAAYLRLSHGAVARTVELAEDIYVDLDQYDVVVGVELLQLDTPVPLDDLQRRFHISAAAMELLTSNIKWGPPRRAAGANSHVQPVVFSASGAVVC